MARELVVGNPYLIQFNLLVDCIYNCNYCYLGLIRKKNKKQFIPVSDILEFLDKFRDYHTEYSLKISLNLTGGDLWLYPDIDKLFSSINEMDFVEDVSLLLNSLWHPQAKKYISIIKRKISLIQLNIDALKDRESDIIYLQQKNTPTVVKILISKNTFYFNFQMEVLKHLRKKVPKLLVSIDRLCPVNKSQLTEMLTSSETEEKIKLIRHTNPDLFIIDDPLVNTRILKKHSQGNSINVSNILNGCIIRGGGLSVYPDGKIKLCSRIPSYETKFDTDNFDLIKYVKKFSSIYQKATSSCQSCALFSQCAGGCPATSFLYNNQELAKDYYCINT